MIEPSPTCYIHIPLPNRNLQSYCWWKTSCTSWGAHRVLIAAVQGFFHQPYVKKAEPNLWDLGYWYPKLWGIFLFNFGVVPKLCFIYDICIHLEAWNFGGWKGHVCHQVLPRQTVFRWDFDISSCTSYQVLLEILFWVVSGIIYLLMVTHLKPFKYITAQLCLSDPVH